MAALTTAEIKIDSQILSHIPILVGQSNYPIWHVKIRNTLSTYGVWEIIEGTNTYATTIVADQEKWKLLDRCMLGLIASTLDDSLINHVSYTYVGSSVWYHATNLPLCGKSPHGQAPCALRDPRSRQAVFTFSQSNVDLG